MVTDTWSPLQGADIYLVDLILRGRIQPGMQVLDVGCGGGRNMRPLLAMGCRVTACDPDLQAIHRAGVICDEWNGQQDRLFTVGAEALPLDEQRYDLVVVNAVLHFAPDQRSWHSWANGCWESLAPGGLFFARVATRIALPAGVEPYGFGYLASETDLVSCQERWGAERAEPLKTTLVERQRCMTTWVLQAPATAEG